MSASLPQAAHAAIRLRQYRRRPGPCFRSPEHIAFQLGVSRACLYRYERGEIVKLETVAAIARLLGLPCEQVIAPISAAEYATMLPEVLSGAVVEPA